MVNHHTTENTHQKEEKKIMVGFIYNCADTKFLLTSLFTVFILFTTIQFIPYKSLIFNPTSFVSCISNLTSSPSPKTPSVKSLAHTDETLNLTIKRSFNPIGSAAYLFIQMGAYRTGPNTFAVIGLASKPIHVYSDPKFAFKWVPHFNSTAASNASLVTKLLPDWGYGRVYTVVVLNCTFDNSVGADGSGGKLVLTASTGSEIGSEEFVTLEEKPRTVNMSVYGSPPKYDYLYCGSPLYGNLSPQRVREWIAYHVKFFGSKSHFVIYDAGGVHMEVMEVLKPWIEKGVVTLHDVREQEKFDGYYHNQFLVVNDCLFRYKHDAKWMFFFDVDEFMYVNRRSTLDGFMKSMEVFTQFSIEQMPMSSKLCLTDDKGKTHRMWGMEKLVYRDGKTGIRRDRKYAIQPRNAYSVGVHLSEDFIGNTSHKTEGKIMYYHYHGTIANRKEPCREFINSTQFLSEKTPYVRDETMRRLANSVKVFELKSIGTRLMRTKQ